MEESTEAEPRKRERREAVLNSLLLKEIMDSSGDEETDKEEQDEEPPKKRAHTTETARPQKQAKANGEVEKGSGGKTKKQLSSAAAASEVENETLIEIIKHKGKFVQLAASKWLERYESKPQEGLNELLLTLFEACGVALNLEGESLVEMDVDDVVKEMVAQAKHGALEDYLGSKQKDVRNFKLNLLTFWDSLVHEAQEGALFDQTLMDKCMDYVIALSCTPPRVFRHVATLVGLQLVTSFVAVAKTLGQSRETAQRQLNAEKRKRKEGARIESLNKILSEKHEKITMVEEMMRKIFTGLFMHRYRDFLPEIRQACISAIGSWIVSYPSLFLQDLYLKYIGWTLNDKNAGVRKSSITALQALYAVDDHVPSLTLFTTRFCNRMVEMADDVDMQVAVLAIGLLKQLLRHQLLNQEDLGSLYDLLIDETPQIRHAVGDLVYENLIAHSSEAGQDEDDLDGQLERVLQILREFSSDPILCDYVIDALWDKCQAMKDWKCIISMLLEDRTHKELNDLDTTNLVRLLSASVKKAVGDKIVPSSEHRKPSLTKAQKELLETRKKEMTLAMVKSHAKLLRKYLADNAKVAAIVDIIQYMQLGLYSLKRQEQNFTSVLQLIKEAFFKHGEESTLKSCIKALTFTVHESHAELQDSANQILKETADDLLVKLAEAEDDYSLIVNLKRLYQLQLAWNVDTGLFADLCGVLEDFSNLDDEVIRLVVLNMFLLMAWSLKGIDPENLDDAAVTNLLGKRAIFMQHLEAFITSLLESWEQGAARNLLTCTMCAILSDFWSLFSQAKLEGTKLQALGFCPSTDLLKQFWKLCEYRLIAPEDSEEEVTEQSHGSEYLNEKDAVMSAAAKLIAHNMVPKDFLGPEILSHYVLHGKMVAETVKQLLVQVKKHSKLEELSSVYLDAMKRAYQRHMDEVLRSDEDWARSESFAACKDLGNRLSATFFGFQRKEYRPSISGTVMGGIDFAFMDPPRQLPFLEAGVVQFGLKLPAVDIREVLANVENRVEGIDTDADPSGWRPYYTFIDTLREKIARSEPAGDKENGAAGKPPKPGRQKPQIKGKKLFENPESSGEEETPPASESGEAIDEDEDDDDDNTPLFQVRQTLRAPVSTGGSRLGTAHKAPKSDTRRKRKEVLSSHVEIVGQEVEDDRGVPPEAERGQALSPDRPGMFGSATEEQLPVSKPAWDAHIDETTVISTPLSGGSTKEDTPTSSSADAAREETPVNNTTAGSKRLVSVLSDDDEDELDTRKRSRLE